MINSMVTDFSFSHLEELARTDEKEKDRLRVEHRREMINDLW